MAQETITIPVRDPAAVRAGRENATGMTAMQTMASKMWRVMLTMGIMTIVAAFVLGIILGLNLGDFFSDAKSVRDMDANHENFGTVMAIKVWLTPLILLGVGFMLAGIIMVLATILGNLRLAGTNVQASLGATVKLPKPPLISKIFPMMMLMGLMTLMGSLFTGAWLGTVAGDVYEHPATDIGGAAAGSELLADLGTVNAVSAWLTPLSFIGMAMLFTGITLALGTIVIVLRFQARRLVEIADEKTP